MFDVAPSRVGGIMQGYGVAGGGIRHHEDLQAFKQISIQQALHASA